MSVFREADVSTAAWQWYLHSHPAPSWIQVAVALYRCGGRYGVIYHTILEGLKDQVPSLKSESRYIMLCAVCTMYGCLQCGCVCYKGLVLK